MAIGQKGVKAGRAYVELGVDDKISRGLRRAQARLKAFGAGVSQIGARLATVGTVAAGALLAAAKVFSSVGDQVAKMSKRTGISVETLSELKFVASQTGAEFGALEKAIAKMQRSIYDAERGLSTQVDAFADLNLVAKDFKGLSPEQQFKLLADRISGVEDPTKKAAIAMSLLGRSGTALLPMFAKGAAGIEALQKKARDLGLTISAEDAAKAEKFTDTMDVLSKVVKMAAFNIGSALAGSMEKAAKAIREKVSAMIEWIKANKNAIVTTAKWVVKIIAVGAALIVVGKIISSVGVIVGGLSVLLKGAVLAVKALAVAFTFLMAHPVIAGIALVAATIGLVVLAIRKATYHTAQLSSRMGDLRKAGDKQRKTDMQRMERLSQLADKEKLNNTEMKEAADLAGKLQGRYGNLGIVIDETTGKIHGMAGAYEHLSKAMKKAALAEVDAEIAELQANISELTAEMESSWSQKNIGVLGEKRSAIQHRIHAVNLRRKAIVGGDEGALTGEAAAETAKIQQKITIEKQKQLDADEKAKRLQDDTSRRKRTIAELELRAKFKGIELEKALLALRRKQAIEAAKAAGQNIKLVEREFELRAKLLDAGQNVEQASRKSVGETRGTFYASRTQGLGGGVFNRVADNTRQTARNTKKLLNKAAAGGLVFTA